ncbi:MAG TPA: lysozyme inhibitor LprI family protein [Bryobacteraceae bacterium]
MKPSRAQSRTSDQTKTKAALHSQVSRIGKDCPNAKTTAEENSCISIVEQQTRTDFAFYGSLHSLLQRSPDDAMSQLDSSQEEWKHYAQKACDAIDSFYRGATIRPSAVTTCRIQLTRSRMRDLDVLYYTTLHL